MEASLDLSRWAEKPRGIAYRRWIIVSTGLRQVFRGRVFRILFGLAWMAGALAAVAGIVFTQSVTTGGWLETTLGHFGPRGAAFAAALSAFVTLYPDICIRALFTVVFLGQAVVALWITLIALTVMVPRLITRDRATQALTVYLSRPLTSGDYLIGKLGIIVGVIATTWTGPLVFGWLLSMVFAPDRDFFVYSLSPFLRALAFNGIALVSLSAIALGVSAVSRSSRNTVLLWLGLWIVGGAIAAPTETPQWLRYASFTHDLEAVRLAVFSLGDVLTDAGTQLPLTNQSFAQNLVEVGKTASARSDFAGGLAALAVLAALSSFVFLRKLRPE